MAAVQTGSTSIRVTWTFPDPLDGTTGYKIDYTSAGGSSGSVTISGNTNSFILTSLTGLTNGMNYTISIAALSMYLVSEYVPTIVVPLGKQVKTPVV